MCSVSFPNGPICAAQYWKLVFAKTSSQGHEHSKAFLKEISSHLEDTGQEEGYNLYFHSDYFLRIR